jgi:protein TonB
MAEEPPEQTDAPALVAVVLSTPDLAFPVPTVGNVLVPGTMATAPPLKPMEAPAPQATNRIYNIGLTDRRGARPPPDYPQEYIRARMTGTVILLIHVDASGVITQVEVEKSTGHPRLDEHTVKHVKRRFTFPAAEGPRVYQLPVGYEL